MVALVATWMFLIAPAVLASELICTVAENSDSRQYLLEIDDDRRTATVTDPKDDQPVPVTVVELTPQRILLGFNSLALEPMTRLYRLSRYAE